MLKHLLPRLWNVIVLVTLLLFGTPLVQPPVKDAAPGLARALSAPAALAAGNSITGRVTDTDGLGLADVTVAVDASPLWQIFLPLIVANQVGASVMPTAENNLIALTALYSTTTDASGYYTVTDVSTGRYVVSAVKASYTFAPAQRTVNVAPDAANQDFVGIAMILIPAGSFQMGCDLAHNGGHPCNGDDALHTISLDAYQIDKYEVTNKLYAQCVEAGRCTAPGNVNSNTRTPYYGNTSYDNYPVIWVNWDQSIAFCQWAGKRLPSEAEWEKAARGSSDNRTYPWGDQAPDCTLANFDSCPINDTSPVGNYPAGASAYGVMDMAGNAWEWVNDWYAPAYYNTSPASNPPGPAAQIQDYGKVLRGGFWYSGPNFLRVAYRQWAVESAQLYNLGFRCAAMP